MPEDCPSQQSEKRVTAKIQRLSPDIHFIMECHSDHLWRWRLMQGAREVLAMGVRGFDTKRKCRAAIQLVVSLNNVPIVSRALSEGCEE